MAAIPTEADFDNLHHALGRPEGPHVKPYRDHFCCDVDGEQARRFDALPDLWMRGRTINGGKDIYYHVTVEGLHRTMTWLADRNRARGLALWRVKGRGFDEKTVLARSAAAARADVYRALADTWTDFSFRDFLSLRVTARRA